MAGKKLTLKQIQSKGGKTTLKKYGRNHFSQLAKDKWAKRRLEKEQAINK